MVDKLRDGLVTHFFISSGRSSEKNIFATKKYHMSAFLAQSCSLWLYLWLSPSLWLWLTLTHSGSLSSAITRSLLGSLRRSCVAPVYPELLRCNSDGEPPDLERKVKKHCQRHNGPEGWVHITSSYTNLDQISISESRLIIYFEISTKHQFLD